MQLADYDAIEWGPVRDLRGGTIQFKNLLNGNDSRPTNFSIVIARTDISFKSPRHRHNFDQVRVTLEGSTNFGPKENIDAGEVAYFPEGTHYGPQNQELSKAPSLAMVIQFGGASGCGYMSMPQLFEGQKALEAKGDFVDGVYRRKVFENGERKNQDAYEAIWEYHNQRPIEYPRPRVTAPIHFRPDNLPSSPQPGQAGVEYKVLGEFNERGTRLEQYLLNADSSLELPANGQERLLFVQEGGLQVTGTDQGCGRYSALWYEADEPIHLTSTESTTLLMLHLPRFS